MPVPATRSAEGSVCASGWEAVVLEAVIARLAATTLPADTPETGGAVAEAIGRIMAALHRMEHLARDYEAGLLSRSEYHAGRVATQSTVHDAELALVKINRGSSLKGSPSGTRPR